LLTLHPSINEFDTINTSLREVRLSDSPHYEALSYSWVTEDGDDTKSSNLYCDGKLLPITKNCEAALRRLREEEARMLWIDAIYINQADNNERGHQVGLMESVYKNASSVQIYLGEPYPDICGETGRPVAEIVAEFLATFGDEMKVLSEDHPRFQGVENFITFREFTRQSDAATASECWEISPIIRGLRDLTSRRWWQRMWAVQEASLAKIAFILWGHGSISYPAFIYLYKASVDSQNVNTLWPLTFHNSGDHLEISKHHWGISRRVKPPEHQLEVIINALKRA
jgi:hypothetical protein